MRLMSIFFTIMLIFASNAKAFGPYERKDLRKHYMASMIGTTIFYGAYKSQGISHFKSQLGAALSMAFIGLAKEALIDPYYDMDDMGANISGIAAGAILTIPFYWSF